MQCLQPLYTTQGAFRGVACLLAYVASVVVRVSSRVIALQPALSPVGATASSCESWMSLQIWSPQRRGGLPRGRRQEGGADDDDALGAWWKTTYVPEGTNTTFEDDGD